MEAIWTRFLPVYARVRDWLNSGAIGKCRPSSRASASTPLRPGSRLFSLELAGGSLLDIGIYNVAAPAGAGVALGACPDPLSMHAEGIRAPTGVDQRAAVTIIFPGAVVSQFVCAFDGSADNSLRIFGDSGWICLRTGSGSLPKPCCRGDRPPETAQARFAINGFERRSKRHAMRARRLTESARMPHEETLAIVECLDELRRQSEFVTRSSLSASRTEAGQLPTTRPRRVHFTHGISTVRQHRSSRQYVGFGAWQLNNPIWGGPDEAGSIELVQAALDAGCNFYDTAPGYGAGQRAAARKALKGGATGPCCARNSATQIHGRRISRRRRCDPRWRPACAACRPIMWTCSCCTIPTRSAGWNTGRRSLRRLEACGAKESSGIWRFDRHQPELRTLPCPRPVAPPKCSSTSFTRMYAGIRRGRAPRPGLVAKVPLDSGWLSGKYDEHSRFDGIRERWPPEVVARRPRWCETARLAAPTCRWHGPRCRSSSPTAKSRRSSGAKTRAQLEATWPPRRSLCRSPGRGHPCPLGADWRTTRFPGERPEPAAAATAECCRTSALTPVPIGDLLSPGEC